MAEGVLVMIKMALKKCADSALFTISPIFEGRFGVSSPLKHYPIENGIWYAIRVLNLIDLNCFVRQINHFAIC